MVTNYGGTGDLMCSSTDVKPTDVAVNTRCLELDTGKFWYFNGTSWTETPGGGGGGGSATLIEKSITANGTYTASDDDADGYSSVDVDVPNTYTVDDNGKVVSNQTLVAQTAKPDTIIVNDTYNTTEYNSVTVNVPNSYTAADEGKVVSQGDLVAQSAYPSTITANDTYDTTNYNSVTVNVGATPTVPEKDVNFYDYDGTLVYSYTKQEFLALSEMPANPTHTGLTAQGWNWSLADAKSYVTDADTLTIGQLYTPTGYIYAFVVEIFDDDKTWTTFVASPGSYSGKIYWGDGESTTASTAGEYSHTYSQAGIYTIGVTGYNAGIYQQNNFSALASSSCTNRYTKLNHIYEVHIGSCYYMTSHCLRGLYNLRAISGYNAPSSYGYVSNWMDTNYVKFIALHLGNQKGNLSGLSNSIEHISVGNMYDTIYLSNLYKLKNVELSPRSTKIDTSTLSWCVSIKRLVIPSTVTTIAANSMNGCTSLASIKFLGSTPPTVANANAFQFLPTTCTIYVPTGSLSDYTSASNYPDPNTYTYVEY